MASNISEKIKSARKRIGASVKVFSSETGKESFKAPETTESKIEKLKRELYGADVVDIMKRASNRTSESSPLTSEFLKEKPTVLVSDGNAPIVEMTSGLKEFELGVAKAIAKFRKEKGVEAALEKHKKASFAKG